MPRIDTFHEFGRFVWIIIVIDILNMLSEQSPADKDMVRRLKFPVGKDPIPMMKSREIRFDEVEKELGLSEESCKALFSEKHNLLLEKAQWQKDAEEQNTSVKSDSPSPGDTFQSKSRFKTDAKLIYTEGPSLQLQKLASQQAADPRLIGIIRSLKKEGKGTVLENYFLEGGILCYQNPPTTSGNGRGKKVIVVPELAARSLAIQIHNAEINAHPRKSRMRAIMKNRYKIIGLERIIEDTINNCTACPYIKPSSMGKRPTFTTRSPKSLSTILYCDILQIMGKNYKVLLYVHATSQLTFCLHIDPSKDLKTQIWDHYYNCIFPLIGPCFLISDNEPLLMSGIAPYKYHTLGSRLRTCIPNLPSGNITERLNRQLLEFFRSKVVSSDMSNEDIKSIVNLWIYSHNFSISTADGLSPIEKFSISRHEALQFAGLSNYEFFSEDADKDAGRLLENQQRILQHLRNRAEFRKKKGYERLADSKYASANPYEVGQLVMLKSNEGRDDMRKLRPTYSGPYLIVSIDGTMLVLAAFRKDHLRQELRKTSYKAGKNLPLFKHISVNCNEVMLCNSSHLRKADCSFGKSFPPLMFWYDDVPNQIARQNITNLVKTAIADRRAVNLDKNNSINMEDGELQIYDHTPLSVFEQEEEMGQREASDNDPPYVEFRMKGHARDSISLSLMSSKAKLAPMAKHISNRRLPKAEDYHRYSFTLPQKGKWALEGQDLNDFNNGIQLASSLFPSVIDSTIHEEEIGPQIGINEEEDPEVDTGRKEEGKNTKERRLKEELESIRKLGEETASKDLTLQVKRNVTQEERNLDNDEITTLTYRTRKRHLIHFEREFGSKMLMPQLQRRCGSENGREGAIKEDIRFESYDVPAILDREDKTTDKILTVHSMKLKISSRETTFQKVNLLKKLETRARERILKTRVTNPGTRKVKQVPRSDKKEDKNISAWLKYINGIKTTQKVDLYRTKMVFKNVFVGAVTSLPNISRMPAITHMLIFFVNAKGFDS